jgi:hypothetical protein
MRLGDFQIDVFLRSWSLFRIQGKVLNLHFSQLTRASPCSSAMRSRCLACLSTSSELGQFSMQVPLQYEVKRDAGRAGLRTLDPCRFPPV